ncbi:MAG TPA: hypothetical protein VGH79_02630 [Gaiellaceae bacterium]|jgi:3-hydroxyacyl-[acyl-carrier-protein] dehydratase
MAELLGKPYDYFSTESATRRRTHSVPKVASEQDAMNYVRQAAIAVSNVSDDRVIEPPLYKDDIALLLPEFDPKHILIDRVTALDPCVSIEAVKTFTEDDLDLGPWYSGTTIVPAVMIIEALSQASAICLLSLPLHRGRIALSAGFNHTRFRKIVNYRDEVRLEAAITHRTRLIAHAAVVASVSGEPVATGECILAIS